ncbi:Dabb family protein [Prosthecobacter sp. SYSU 5D2]|uniref:Dabb family protein n=1 Tax=Prosthecobacter sp. SYSU 5D2 TaxID=3134134 RepID=UPI0031FEF70E
MNPFRTRLVILVSFVSLISSCTLPQRTGPSATDIHQIGLVWLKNAGSQEDRQKVVEAVHSFGADIPEVKQAVVGRTDGIGGPFSDASYDVGFILTFKDEAARQRYNEHPVHQKAATEVFLPLSKKLLFYRFVAE